VASFGGHRKCKHSKQIRQVSLANQELLFDYKGTLTGTG